MKRILTYIIGGFALLSLSGCVVYERPARVVERREYYDDGRPVQVDVYEPAYRNEVWIGGGWGWHERHEGEWHHRHWR